MYALQAPVGGTMKKLSWLAAVSALLIGGSVFVSCGGSDSDGGSDPVLDKITVDASAAKTVFAVGDDFSADGLSVKAVMSDKTKKTLSADEYTVALAAANLGENGKIIRAKNSGHSEEAVVTVTYEEKTATYNVTVSDVVTKLKLTIGPNVKTEYDVGEEFDPTDITVKAFYGEDDVEGEDVTESAKITATVKDTEGNDVVFTTEKAGDFTVTLTAEYAGKTDSVEATVTVKEQGGETPVDTGSEEDLAAYVYHKSIIAGMADIWTSGTGVNVADGKATLVSGNLWGAGGVCGVSPVELGEIADYAYIVFTIDTTSYTVSEAKADLKSNTGVNVKIPEIIVRPSKWFTKNGKTTYYIATSEFSNASTANTIALIIGGEGTLVIDEFYLAAIEEPAEKVIEYANTTVYSKGDNLTFAEWGVGISAECTENGIVANGKSPYYAVNPVAPVQFKAGAKLEVTYTANAAWQIKPVAPEEVIDMDAGENVTKTVSLGDKNAVLTAIGLVLSVETTEVTITSIKVVDNEE